MSPPNSEVSTFSMHIETAYQSTVPSQIARAVLSGKIEASRTHAPYRTAMLDCSDASFDIFTSDLIFLNCNLMSDVFDGNLM